MLYLKIRDKTLRPVTLILKCLKYLQTTPHITGLWIAMCVRQWKHLFTMKHIINTEIPNCIFCKHTRKLLIKSKYHSFLNIFPYHEVFDLHECPSGQLKFANKTKQNFTKILNDEVCATVTARLGPHHGRWWPADDIHKWGGRNYGKLLTSWKLQKGGMRPPHTCTSH